MPRNLPRFLHIPSDANSYHVQPNACTDIRTNGAANCSAISGSNIVTDRSAYHVTHRSPVNESYSDSHLGTCDCVTDCKHV